MAKAPKYFLVLVLALCLQVTFVGCSQTADVSYAPSATGPSADASETSAANGDATPSDAKPVLTKEEQLVAKESLYRDYHEAPLETYYAYDDRGRLISEETTTNYQQWEYDSADHLIFWSSSPSKEEAADQTKRYSYDDSGVLAEIIHEGAEMVWIECTPATIGYSYRLTFDYDTAANVLTIAGYDANGESQGVAKKYFDKGHEWSKLSIDSGQKDKPFKIEVFDPSGALRVTVSYVYDDSGNRIKVINDFVGKNMLETTFAYDNRGNLAAQAESDANGVCYSTRVIRAYTADSKPHRSVTMTIAEDEPCSLYFQEFAYDNLGRVISETSSSGDARTLARFTDYTTFEYVGSDASDEVSNLALLLHEFAAKFAVGQWETDEREGGEPLMTLELFVDGTGAVNDVPATWASMGADALLCTTSDNAEYYISFMSDIPTISDASFAGAPTFHLRRTLDEDGFPLITL